MNLHSHSISSLQGVLTVPGDKSISHRAAILGGLAQGVTEVDNFLCSEDCLNTLRAMEQLGADARHALYVGDSEVDVEMAPKWMCWKNGRDTVPSASELRASP